MSIVVTAEQITKLAEVLRVRPGSTIELSYDPWIFDLHNHPDIKPSVQRVMDRGKSSTLWALVRSWEGGELYSISYSIDDDGTFAK